MNIRPLPSIAPAIALAMAVLASTTLPATPIQPLLLSEVFYDRAGADDGYEWVELFNPTAAALDLREWSLGYGGSDYAFGVVQLSGVVLPNAYFVVGGGRSDASNASPAFDQVVDFEPDMQNAGTVADGVGLFRAEAARITAASVPVDAVIYGTRNDNALLGPMGVPGEVDVEDAPSGSSLTRLASRAWAIASVPSPGTGSLLAAAPAPAPPSVALAGLALLVMMAAARFSPMFLGRARSKRC